jgi:hypothetical protein
MKGVAPRRRRGDRRCGDQIAAAAGDLGRGPVSRQGARGGRPDGEVDPGPVRDDRETAEAGRSPASVAGPGQHALGSRQQDPARQGPAQGGGRGCRGRSAAGRPLPAIQVWRSVREGNDTKTSKSRRTLELPQRCVEALKDHRARQDVRREAAGKRWHHTNLVFTSELGTELDAANVRRAFRKVVAAAGLPAGEWGAARTSPQLRVAVVQQRPDPRRDRRPGRPLQHRRHSEGAPAPVATGATKMNDIFPGAKPVPSRSLPISLPGHERGRFPRRETGL